MSIDGATDLLTLNGEFTTSVVIARCFSMPTGARRWKVRIDASCALTSLLRSGWTTKTVRRSTITFSENRHLRPRLHLTEENGFMVDTYRCDSIQAFYALASRTHIRTAA